MDFTAEVCEPVGVSGFLRYSGRNWTFNANGLPMADRPKYRELAKMNHKLKITKQILATIDKYRPVKGKAFLRDTTLTGFAICVSAGQSTYVAEGKIKGTRTARRKTIGRVELVDLDDAKRQARSFLLDLANGIDSKNESGDESERKVPTLEQALELYLQQRPLTQNSQRQYKNNITVNLQSLMQKPIDSISETLVIREFERIKKRAPVVAHKVMAMLHGVLSFASAHPDCRYKDGTRMLMVSPVRILSELRMTTKPKPRTDHLTVDELPAFAEALSRVDDITAKNLILFILLTGCRLDEARLLRWNELSMLRFRIDLPAERVKTKSGRVLPITTEILAILEQQGQLKSEISAYVFPSKTGVSHIAENAVRQAFTQVRNEINRSGLKIHGLRRTYITLTSKHQIMSEHEQKLLVGHALDQTGRYRQTSFEDLKSAAQRATTHIAKIMTQNEVDTEAICSR